MLQIFYTPQGAKSATRTEEFRKGAWICMEGPSDKEIETVRDVTGIPEDLLKAALDEEERARIELDDGVKLILVDMPIVTEKEDEPLRGRRRFKKHAREERYVYSTQPLGIVLTDDYIVTVCINKNTPMLSDFQDGRVKNMDLNKRTRFVYQLLYHNAVKYLSNLRQIDKVSLRVQVQLHRAMKNKELLQLLDLEKSLVYFSTSLNANQLVLDKMISSQILPHFAEDQDLLDDVVIENKQAIEMCNVHRDVLSGTMDAFASVISNNQNIVMKFLAAVTIILALPQVIASLWGMNVNVPFKDTGYGFWVVLALTVGVVGIVSFIMFRRKMF